jgi:homoserine dehydrogenase
VVIDCTNSDAVGAYYERWLKAGINVISPSRKLSAGPLANFLRVKEAMRASK